MLRRNRTYKHLSDEELVEQYQRASSKKIISELYIRYSHLVFGTALKYLKNRQDAEDVTSVIFELLGDKLKRHQISTFKSWLYMVSKNECLMFLRKNKMVSSELKQELVSEDVLENKIQSEIQLNLLEETIDTLKEEQKKCIKLFYLDNKSYNEITEILKLDIKRVKSAIQNGKRNLKIKLEGRNEFKSFT